MKIVPCLPVDHKRIDQCAQGIGKIDRIMRRCGDDESLRITTPPFYHGSVEF